MNGERAGPVAQTLICAAQAEAWATAQIQAKHAPSFEAMVAWLSSEAVVTPDGGVFSWINADHPGYRYPEAAGLLVSFLARHEPERETLRARVVGGLLADISPESGCGRGPRQYVFDTAVVLSALIDHRRAGGWLPEDALLDRLFGFIAGCLAARRAFRGGPQTERSWSLSYGCHLLKVVGALSAYREERRDARASTLIQGLVADLLPLYAGGRFRIHAHSPRTYLHANCYAVEGLLCLGSRGLAEVGSELRQCAQWMAEIQHPLGGIPAWHDGASSYGECRADATAQAIRIWARVDRSRFEGQISRGLEYLAQLQQPGGGLLYDSRSGDVNTWVTIFAAEAVEALTARRLFSPFWPARPVASDTP